MTAKVGPIDGKTQTRFHNESRVGEARVHTRFVIWEGQIGERHKQSTEQNTKTKNMNLISNKTQPR
jgi:hypothetical protein